MKNRLFGLFITLALVMTGCGSEEETTTQKAATAQPTPAVNAIEATKKAAEATEVKTVEIAEPAGTGDEGDRTEDRGDDE